MRYKDQSPARTSFWSNTAVFLVFAGLVYWGSLPLQVLGVVGLFSGLLQLALDRGYVDTAEHGIRLANHVRGWLRYDEIDSVGRFSGDLYPGFWKYLASPAQKQVVESTTNPALEIHLRKPVWLWSIYPIPVLWRYSSVKVYLEGEEEEEFLALVRQLIATAE